MTETDRQQRVVERILEDESLRGELEDQAATALINWASERAGTIAADSSRSDQEVDAATQAIRMAAREAANGGESDAERLVAAAEAALAKQAPPAPPAAPVAAETTPHEVPAPPTPEALPAGRAEKAAPGAARESVPSAAAPASPVVLGESAGAEAAETASGAPGQKDAEVPASHAERPAGDANKAAPSKRRSKRRQRSRRKSK